MLEAIGVSHNFDYDLFSDINLQLNKKESIAILGVSGSGKSTLMHILSSFMKPNSGKININGESIYDLPSKKLEDLRRYNLGMIFQQHYLFRGFTGMENILSASLMAEQSIDNQLLEKLGIDQVINQSAADLSGGQQQRVSVARVLVKKPQIIFADEPTGNLDKDTAKSVMDVLYSYVKEEDRGMFLVTHDEKIASSCDKIYLLENKILKEL
ncbi:MAG: ATP-binding cassette domain-containing protein [Campylobacterales bacterium]|nr:ATP-binding cassette domain-containing protein [Campylobacterales bacterium]